MDQQRNTGDSQSPQNLNRILDITCIPDFSGLEIHALQIFPGLKAVFGPDAENDSDGNVIDGHTGDS